MNPDQYAKVDNDALDVWCAAFKDDGENDPCDCLYEYEKYLPNVEGFLIIYGLILAVMWVWALAGLGRPNRCNMELGVAGFPNSSRNHMARLQVPSNKSKSLPMEILSKRLGRSVRDGNKPFELEWSPRCSCNKGEGETIAIHQDHLHLQSRKGLACWQRCFCKDMKPEVDDYYVLLKDTGFVEVVEDNKVTAKIVLTLLALSALVTIVCVMALWTFSALSFIDVMA
eukprot:SAG31_NODE_14230_length_819_cov_1.340278_2_plen_226_part_01